MVSKGCAYRFLSSTSHQTPLPPYKHLRSPSAWRCSASLHCHLRAVAEPGTQVTKNREENGPDPGSPSLAGFSSEH